MRWLKNLVPEDVRESLNANPGFQWLVIVFMFVVGVLLIMNGVNGIKTKRLKGKNGRVFQGKTAQILGVIYCLFGLILPIIAIATKL